MHVYPSLIMSVALSRFTNYLGFYLPVNKLFHSSAHVPYTVDTL